MERINPNMSTTGRTVNQSGIYRDPRDIAWSNVRFPFSAGQVELSGQLVARADLLFSCPLTAGALSPSWSGPPQQHRHRQRHVQPPIRLGLHHMARPRERSCLVHVSRILAPSGSQAKRKVISRAMPRALLIPFVARVPNKSSHLRYYDSPQFHNYLLKGTCDQYEAVFESISIRR